MDVTTLSDDVAVALEPVLSLGRGKPAPQTSARAMSLLEANCSVPHPLAVAGGMAAVFSAPGPGKETPNEDAAMVVELSPKHAVLMVADGLDIFRVPIPPELAGVTLVQSRLRERTGCMVVAWQAGDDLTLTPHASMTIPVKGDLVVIGTAAAEARFLDLFGG